MGVAWGVVAYPENEDRAELISRWKPVAEHDERGLNIMHGKDMITLFPDGTVAVRRDRDAWAQLEELSCGDGSYDLFERLFDGYELFVPFPVQANSIDAPGSPAEGKRCASLESLIKWTGYEVDSDDRNLRGLAQDLYDTALVARDLRLMIEIAF